MDGFTVKKHKFYEVKSKNCCDPITKSWTIHVKYVFHSGRDVMII